VLKFDGVDLPEEYMDDMELYKVVRKAYNDANEDYLKEQAAIVCEYCPNNPQNNGSGICSCILGMPRATC